MSASINKVKRPPLLWFPLLAKELTEKANRPRTYWIRTGYALALYPLIDSGERHRFLKLRIA